MTEVAIEVRRNAIESIVALLLNLDERFDDCEYEFQSGPDIKVRN